LIITGRAARNMRVDPMSARAAALRLASDHSDDEKRKGAFHRSRWEAYAPIGHAQAGARPS
jgi:hypothetical protein